MWGHAATYDCLEEKKKPKHQKTSNAIHLYDPEEFIYKLHKQVRKVELGKEDKRKYLTIYTI